MIRALALAVLLPALAYAEPVKPEMRPAAPTALGVSLWPQLRPRELMQKFMARREAAKRGSVCGDAEIQGVALGPMAGRIAGCGIDQAVRVRSVRGVSLSTEAVMDCRTAKALKTWIVRGAEPTIGSTGGGLAGLRVYAHYACRTRNNKPGGKISEHGRGRAIDIGGFILRDGREISVLDGWSGRNGPALRAMHKSACGPFGTVLGPGSDGHHGDHFHFDTALYRSGPYCR
ncbi:Uncharacterized conserved protein [Poseidonocella pacifica]|uniref:Uncharacterized conserved protein n=1 Tax=Poseidonocella pacifica TaxID=871651 RepID=A0A1I0XI75_9RHOB|nr:extensin family protein [Poseidonocella pacifica]SFA99653.1 Uncharacterized conserved protein [Poseidonocella pacifica]